MRYWKPEDVFDVRCPHCETPVEFFKDEPALECPSCGKEVRNPKIDLACATIDAACVALKSDAPHQA